MANIKISELTAAGALTGTELVEIVQDGVNVQTTAQDIADLGGGGGGAITVVAQPTDLTIDGASGTVYTNEGAAGRVTFTLPDSAVGTQYTFVNVDAFDIWVATPAGTQIVFYDFWNSGITQTIDTDSTTTYLQLGTANQGASVTILKTAATRWSVISNTGAEYYAD